MINLYINNIIFLFKMLFIEIFYEKLFVFNLVIYFLLKFFLILFMFNLIRRFVGWKKNNNNLFLILNLNKMF